MSVNQDFESYYVNLGLTPKPVDEINKLQLNEDIVLNDFVFNTIDSDGVVWVVSDIEGWWTTPEAEVPEIARGLGDGSYDIEGRYSSRTLTISGSFLTTDRAKVEAARDRLVDAMNLVYKGAWLKTGKTVIRASWVRIVGGISIETINSRGRTNFQISLRAHDPIKYLWNPADPDGYEVVEILAKNSTIEGSGSATITNIGNYPVPCYIEVIGPVASPATIYNRTTDKLIVITQSLKGRFAQRLEAKEISFDESLFKDVATITTRSEHRFSVNDVVSIAGTGEEFDGDRVIVSVPTSTTFTFYGDSADISSISHKSLTSGVATLETTRDYEFVVGDDVVVSGVDAAFNGTYEVTDTPTARSFSYALNRVTQATIVSKVLIANIATLTTSNPHQFVVGETVTIEGVDDNYNGTFEITSVPSSNQFSYTATRTNARDVVTRSMSNDVATLTTAQSHGFIANENVNVSNVGFSFNGGFSIESVPTATTFTYRRVRSTQRNVNIRSRTSNVITLVTTAPHGFIVGEKVTVENVDAAFDGTYTITSIPSTNSFTYAKTGSNLIATAVQSGLVRSKSRKVVQRDLVANIATLVTEAPHGAFVGEQIIVTGIDSTFNGTYTVLSIPSANTLTYSRVAANVPPLGQGDPALTSAFVEMSGTITSASVTPTGLATVAGSLPFSSASGTASVPSDIVRRISTGSVVKPNDVLFTSGLPNSATATMDADILEIETRNRDVFFNGFVEGARAKIDVLADFIQLAPGENQIEFEDQGSPDGEATMKIYYRSGWLA